MPRHFITPSGLNLYQDRLLGKGSYGAAVAVRDARGNMYCVKEVAIQVRDETAKQNALREVEMMRVASPHPNVVAFYESWFDRNRLCILMEYAPGASLDVLLRTHTTRGMHLPPTKVRHYTEELVLALQHCHDTLGIMHRDIKPGNILIDSLGTLKLADFGLSKALGPNNLATTFCGSPLYMSPEQLTEGENYSFSADMWALGCVIYEMMALRSPWVHPDDDAHQLTFPSLMHRILHSAPDYAPLLVHYPDRLVRVAKWMLRRDPARRATAVDVAELLDMAAPPVDLSASIAAAGARRRAATRSRCRPS